MWNEISKLFHTDININPILQAQRHDEVRHAVRTMRVWTRRSNDDSMVASASETSHRNIAFHLVNRRR